MRAHRGERRVVASTILAMCAAATALRAQALADVECTRPPLAHCEESCADELELLGVRGNAVDPATGRKFFLDFPCDLRPGERVLFILSLHGAGAPGNWYRHYFPALDYVDKYRLVVATPTAEGFGPGLAGGAAIRRWVPDMDDAYLQDVVNLVLDRFGRENIRAFWLAGHSQGGMTANRLVCTPFFSDKVDGWLSLSGGRIGPAQINPDLFGSNGPPPSLSSGDPDTPHPGAAVTPSCDISYIFESGEKELVALPDTSPLATRYHCDARERRPDIVDDVKGYVTAPGGRKPRPGTAQLYVYPNCDGGRLVADVLRLGKGHTEGLEPRVTEALIRLMSAAPGGKIAAGS